MTAMIPDRLMFAVLPEYPRFSEALGYQFSGLMVVFVALGLIWGLLELSGAFFRRAARKLESSVVPVATATQAETPAPEAVSSLDYALIVATVHAASQGRARILSVEAVDAEVIHAVIVAAVHCMFEGRARVVSIEPVHADTAWAREGRRDIFASHRIR